MRFAHPELLWLLLLLLPLGLLAASRLRGARRALANAVGREMGARLTGHLALGRRAGRLLLVLLACAFLILGVAQPQRGSHYATAARTGIDLVIALDVSESMLAEDLRPNRLLRARHEISGVLDRLEGDRVGLVAFAGAAFVQCPLTLDYGAARLFLDFMAPELIPEPGTSLADAIRVGLRAFGEESEGFRAMILITDGEDHVGEVEEAAREAREAGVRIFTVGIGSETGEPIPLRDADGQVGGHKKDRDGRVVLTRLDALTLERVADLTGGVFVRAGGRLGLERVLAEIQRMERRELEAGIRVVYQERYAYFAWLALAALLMEWRIPLRRLRRRRSLAGRASGVLAVGLAIVVTAGALAQTPSGQPPAQMPLPPGALPTPPGAPPASIAPQQTEPIDEEAWQAEVERNEIFRARHPEDPRPLYNLGNLYHQKGELETAADFYGVALGQAAPELSGRIVYNLGNTLFLNGDPAAARDAFLEALRIDPNNESAKRNLELAQMLLDSAQQMPDSLQQRSPDGQPPPDSPESEQQQQGEEEPQDSQGEAQEQQEEQEQQEQQEGREQQDPQSPEGQSERQPEDAQQPEEGSETQEEQPAGGQEEESLQDRPEEAAQADSSAALTDVQIMQILRGLEGAERELLEQRFRARGRNMRVEKDW